MRRVAFLPEAFTDFAAWATIDRKVYAKIVETIRDIQRDPFGGIANRSRLNMIWQVYGRAGSQPSTDWCIG